MSDSDDSKSQLSSLLAPGLIIAAVSVAGYLNFNPPLSSDRPDLAKNARMPEPPSPPEIHALHSRLWDDPLAVAFNNSQERRSPKLKASLPGFRRSDPLHVGPNAVQHDLDNVVNEFLGKSVVDAAGQKARTNRLLVMPVLVPGQPFEDDVENRKRTTYALLSALGAARYHLKSPEQMTYVELPIDVFDQPIGRTLSIRIVVPIKLFVPDGKRGDESEQQDLKPAFGAIIVCWINEAQLGSRPMAVLGQILHGLFGTIDGKGESPEIDLRIIGPASSDMLLDMAEEDAAISNVESVLTPGGKTSPVKSGAGAGGLPAIAWLLEEGLQLLERIGLRLNFASPPDPQLTRKQFRKRFRNPMLLSPIATISDLEFKDTQSAFAVGGESNSGLAVIRTINTDDVLADAIRDELELRGASPAMKGDGRYVVIVTESDTHYGRAMARAFRRTFENVLEKKTEHTGGQLQLFTYLQGIDGKLADGAQQDGDSSAKSAPNEFDPLHPSSAESLPASGRSQYDYLRRLESQLQQFHDERRNAGEEGIKAIGVVGADVYDKLLVLRALRKRFPRVWFFTTDLDAELSRTGEYTTTRNLLVASHYGLRLQRDLQHRAPPFRNSYQTSIFLACMLAAGQKNACEAAACPHLGCEAPAMPRPMCDRPDPLVFEIGRSGPYQLTMTEPSGGVTARVQPHSPRERGWLNVRHGILAIVLITAVLALLSMLSSRWRKILGNGTPAGFLKAIGLVMIVLIAVALGIAAVHRYPGGEPFLIFEGISLWPPILIRFVTALLGARFFYNAFREFKDPNARDPSTLFSFWNRPADSATRSLEEWHRDEGHWKLRLCRTAAFALAFWIASFCLVTLTDLPIQPYRGSASEIAANLSMPMAVVALLLVTAFTVDALWLCRVFVARLRDTAHEDSPPAVDKGTSLDLDAYDPRPQIEVVHRIASTTRVVGKHAWYPLSMILLMVLARSKTFDIVDFSWPLLVIWIGLAGTVVVQIGLLRRAADETRDKILDRLRRKRIQLIGMQVPPTADARFEAAIQEIEREDGGAFRPFSQDPLFHSLALLFGGSGGLLLLEQLIPYL